MTLAPREFSGQSNLGELPDSLELFFVQPQSDSDFSASAQGRAHVSTFKNVNRLHLFQVAIAADETWHVNQVRKVGESLGDGRVRACLLHGSMFSTPHPTPLPKSLNEVVTSSWLKHKRKLKKRMSASLFRPHSSRNSCPVAHPSRC